MAVIINELEVVLESPATPGPAASAQPSPQPSQSMQPLDVTDILEREVRARRRLLAH